MFDTRFGWNRGFCGVSHLAALVGLLLVAQGRVAAQQGPLLPGETVRLTSVTPGIGVRVGVVQAIDRDTVWLREEGTGVDLAIPNQSIRALFVADGWRRQTGKGAVFGLLAGAVLGAGIGLAADALCIPITSDCESTGIGVGVLVGAPAGLVIGTVVGTAIRSRRWRPGAVPPTPGGLHLELGTRAPALMLSWTP